MRLKTELYPYASLFISNEDKWYDTFDKIKRYVKDNNTLPSQHDKNPDIKQLGQWLHQQINNNKKHQHSMKDDNIRKIWEEFVNMYSAFFISKEEKWYDTLEKVKLHIKTNNKLPSLYDKNQDIKQLGLWVSNQKGNYKKHQHSMKDDNIRKIWEEFVNMCSAFFMSNEEKWYDTLEKVKTYIKTNNKLPSQHDKIQDIKRLGLWISTQKINCNKQKDIMKDDNIRKMWEEFVYKYSSLFI
jgi:hypothetical protein